MTSDAREKMAAALRAKPRDGRYLLKHFSKDYLDTLRAIQEPVECGYGRGEFRLYYWIDSNRKSLRRALSLLGIHERSWQR